MRKGWEKVADQLIENNFTKDEKKAAFTKAEGKCECCGKSLVYEQNGRSTGPLAWEAHHDETTTGTPVPIILCTEPPEECHLRCAHAGEYVNEGIRPSKHI